MLFDYLHYGCRLEREIFTLAESRHTVTVKSDNANSSSTAEPDRATDKQEEQNSISTTDSITETLDHKPIPDQSSAATETQVSQQGTSPNLQNESAPADQVNQEIPDDEEDLDVTKGKLMSYASLIHKFRRCSLSASKKNEKLLCLITQTHRLISRLTSERDALSDQLDKISGAGDSKARSRSETKLVVEQHVENDADYSEVKKRLLYLERWKATAMTTIEAQLKYLDESVSKSSYIQVVGELDVLKRDNIFLTDAVATAQASLMRYRDIVKSLGYGAGTEELELPSLVATNDRVKALSVSFTRDH